MASVWYLGTADRREITVAEWAKAGITGVSKDSVWDVNNGYSVPQLEFTQAQLDILALDYRFQVGAPDGPRVGPSFPPAPPGAQRFTQLEDFFRSLARTPDAIITGAVTRDANGAATSAPVVWPDGSPGIYTALELSTTFPGAVDSYQITYGSPVTKTYTQPAVTRDATTGAASLVPAITVS